MTGKFSQIDSRKCTHYARFFQNLTLVEANSIFWVLFIIVLILMCYSSLQHHKSITLNDLEKGIPPGDRLNKRRLKTRRIRLRMLSAVSLCLVLSGTCAVLECFAAFNIEYCDGEDLMQLYWGFWSVLQVGSNIAILGVMVQFWIVLGDVETPSWAVALGTPVLVFAALGFVFRAITKKALDRCRGKRDGNGSESDSDSDDEEAQRGRAENEEGGEKTMGRWMSQAPTLAPESEYPSRPDTGGSEGSSNRTESRSNAGSGSNSGRPRGGHHQSTFWSRDLHYVLNSIVSDHPREHGRH